MQRFRTALLVAFAVGASVPSIASAQMGDQRSRDRADRDQGGQRFEQGRQTGQREYRGGQDRSQFQPQQYQAAPQQQQPAQMQAPRGRFGGVDRLNREPGFGQRPGERRLDFAGNPGERRGGFDGRQGFDPGSGHDGRQGFDGRQRYDGRQAFGQRQGDPRQNFGGNGFRGDQRFAYDRGQGFRGADLPQGRVGANWRNDRRYDWRGYRDGHRDIFRTGRYQPPRAYYNRGYRSFGIGARLDPFFYASNYWIDDPYDYRLPPAGGSLRWVRYFDDVLLVDLRTGQIVDVIQQFFW